MEFKTALLCALVSVLACCWVGVQGCTDWPPHIRSRAHDEPDEQKVYYSEYVVFGTAGATKKDPYPFANVNGVKTILFDVTCIYKTKEGDPPVPKEIKVTAVGNKNGSKIPGCPPAPLDKGQTAVLFLRKLRGQGQPDDLYEIEFKPISDPSVDDNQKLDDLTLLCGLNRSFPAKGEEDPICYEPLGAEDCMKYKPKTPKPEMKPVTTPKVAEVTNKPVKVEPTTKPEGKGEEEPKPEEEGGENVGKPISPNKDNTYATDTGKSSGPENAAPVQILSKSLVVLLSVLYALV